MREDRRPTGRKGERKRVESNGEENKGDKGGNYTVIKVVKTIIFIHDVERGTLSQNSPHAIQDLTVY
jgi:hypothetical protein